MKRVLGILAGAVLLAGVALQPASAGEVQRFTYVGHEFSSGLVAPVNDQTAGGTIPALRPLGDVRFTATSERFTLTIDDAKSIGSVPVWIFAPGWEFRGCVPVGAATTFTGATRGEGVSVWILGSSYGVYMGCGGGATTGIADVSQ